MAAARQTGGSGTGAGGNENVAKIFPCRQAMVKCPRARSSSGGAPDAPLPPGNSVRGYVCRLLAPPSAPRQSQRPSAPLSATLLRPLRSPRSPTARSRGRTQRRNAGRARGRHPASEKNTKWAWLAERSTLCRSTVLRVLRFGRPIKCASSCFASVLRCASCSVVPP
jgi:hypothetical protein